jgi:NADH-quinone oxidoreductase subunit J
VTFVFYLSAIIAVLATVMVITRHNAIHALLYLIVSLLSVAVIFFTLGAPFVAALEIIIYAGAIMVLFVFVMMMLNLGQQAAEQERQWLNLRMYIGPAVFAAVLLIELIYVFASVGVRQLSGQGVGPKAVAIELFSSYLLAVELAAMLLLAGLVGAFHLGRKAED